MKNPEQSHHPDNANQEAGRKIGAGRGNPRIGALMDADEHRGGKQAKDQFQREWHDPHYGAKAMNPKDAHSAAERQEASGEAAHAGKELSALIRECHAMQSPRPQEIYAGLAKLIAAPARTPIDALAFAATAQRMMPLAIFMVKELLDDTDPANASVVGCISELINRTVETLEAATGISAATFTGEAPAMN